MALPKMYINFKHPNGLPFALLMAQSADGQDILALRTYSQF
jgi:hypothetical protein